MSAKKKTVRNESTVSESIFANIRFGSRDQAIWTQPSWRLKIRSVNRQPI